ncbi:hypothetical protein H2201_007890 [Coniosporium apollinis]|uniref:Uncharacterized protein n=1 Tax=Coniosporium apollinis TaxID=61459 RepID=A0ABQ9NIC3_9PEZI|nr:hypothetical protein H2201_007890 [Coniosporium apollinis]
MQLINKLSVAAVAALATLGSAHSHRRHAHIARQGYSNETVSHAYPTEVTGYPTGGETASPTEMTTSTIYSTATFTITSCAPTITNCPADATKVVTSVIAVSTTVCPKSEVGSSSSGYADSSSWAYPDPSSSAVDPIGTGVHSYPASSVAATETPIATEVTNSTLTYTLGTGSSTTVITTTIRRTSTQYATKTVIMTRPTSDANATETGPVGTESGSAPTTTISSTSTLTRVVTVYPVPAGSSSIGTVKEVDVTSSGAYPDVTGMPGYGEGPSSTEGSGNGASSTEGSGNGGSSTGLPGYGEGPSSTEGSGNSGSSTEGGSCVPTTVTITEQKLVTVTATPSPTHIENPIQSSSSAYYPTGGAGNDTDAYPTGVASTGFVTMSRPVKPTGYGNGRGNGRGWGKGGKYGN